MIIKNNNLIIISYNNINIVKQHKVEHNNIIFNLIKN